MARIENVNIDGTSYDVGKIATTSAPGVVQVGSGLGVTNAGVLSANVTSVNGSTGAVTINVPTVDSSLSTSSTNAIQNKAVANALNEKVNVASVDLTNQTTTILAQVKALGSSQKNYGRFYSKTDGGSANISDKPTGTTNASFVCVAYQSRNNGASDYTYQLLCWVQGDTNPYKATVTTATSSISWARQQPTVNNATLTIQKNGTNVQTFTANASSNVTANIVVPTKTSDLTNDSNFVASGSLATVATSGSYNDLSNKPTIPTVNNATLTIQKNGSTVNTFTANASSNVTANITVPTQTSDLTNNSGFLTSSTGVTSVNGAHGAVTGIQTTSNLVTSVSSSSTNSQYPSAKLFYDTVGNVESVLQTLNSGTGV